MLRLQWTSEWREDALLSETFVDGYHLLVESADANFAWFVLVNGEVAQCGHCTDATAAQEACEAAVVRMLRAALAVMNPKTFTPLPHGGTKEYHELAAGLIERHYRASCDPDASQRAARENYARAIQAESPEAQAERLRREGPSLMNATDEQRAALERATSQFAGNNDDTQDLSKRSSTIDHATEAQP